MANMSYCRFTNTYGDLQDCRDHLHDMDLSEREEEDRKRLVRLCRNIVSSWGDDEEEEAK